MIPYIVPFVPVGGGEVGFGRIVAAGASEAACLFVREVPGVIVWGYPVPAVEWVR